MRPEYNVVVTVLDYGPYGSGTHVNQRFGPFLTRETAEEVLMVLAGRANVKCAVIEWE
jgi:rare lipoprotein A (peptidoglycan hydrolase)